MVYEGPTQFTDELLRRRGHATYGGCHQVVHYLRRHLVRLSEIVALQPFLRAGVVL